MSRSHRLLLTDRIFFVNVNLHPMHHDFRDSEYPVILKVIDESRQRHKFLFCGYVLMPDRWHALVWPRPPEPIDGSMHDMKKVSSQRLHRARGTHGPFWQHQFWDRFVRHAQEFRERLDYMHLNSVRRGLVKQPEELQWSSYNNFSLDKAVVATCPIRIDDARLPEGYWG